MRERSSACMRINYWAQDRQNIVSAVKEMARCVSQPNTRGIGDEEEMWVGTLWAIRGWYRDFLTPLQVDTFTFNVDSDHAGCLKDTKVHNRHHSRGRDNGSIDDRDGVRIVKLRVRVLRCCARHRYSVGHEEHVQKLRTGGQGCT